MILVKMISLEALKILLKTGIRLMEKIHSASVNVQIKKLMFKEIKILRYSNLIIHIFVLGLERAIKIT